jgi:hypothetical protein
MSALTDAKVVLLSLLSDNSGYWNETPIANLPANVKLTSSSYDKSITTPQVVVGDQTMEPGEWNSAKDYLMKPKCDVHTFIYRDLSATGGNISGQDYGTLKKQEYAMIENIRVILTKHSDRPTSDCMFVFYDPQIVDRDIRNQRELMLHKIIRCTCWLIQTYT